MSKVYIKESVWSYINVTQIAQIRIVLSCLETYLSIPIDYSRIRNGENKYLVREVFKRLYPELVVPMKTPVPRPMNK